MSNEKHNPFKFFTTGEHKQDRRCDDPFFISSVYRAYSDDIASTKDMLSQIYHLHQQSYPGNVQKVYSGVYVCGIVYMVDCTVLVCYLSCSSYSCAEPYLGKYI